MHRNVQAHGCVCGLYVAIHGYSNVLGSDLGRRTLSFSHLLLFSHSSHHLSLLLSSYLSITSPLLALLTIRPRPPILPLHRLIVTPCHLFTTFLSLSFSPRLPLTRLLAAYSCVSPAGCSSSRELAPRA